MVTVEEVVSLKVPELREELKSRNLETVGLKADLVKRLENALKKEASQSNETTTKGKQPTPSSNAPAAKSTTQQESNGRAPIEFKAGPSTNVNPSNITNSLPEATALEGTKPDPNAPAATPSTAVPVQGLTEEEKKKQRAERFGVPLSEKEKLAARAQRFGSGTPGSSTADGGSKGITQLTEAEKLAELEKRNERAKRFNLAVPLTSDELETKKKARLARFGTEVEDTKTLQDKLAKRAERFALNDKSAATTPSVIPQQPKPYADPELEAKRKAREIRFQAK